MIVTKKLKAAAALLAGERFADSTDKAVLSAITNADALYRALNKMGYFWQMGGYWRLVPPPEIRRVIARAQRLDNEHPEWIDQE
jgi:hypothetical protein